MYTYIGLHSCYIMPHFMCLADADVLRVIKYVDIRHVDWKIEQLIKCWACVGIDFTWHHHPEGDKVFRSHRSRQTDRPGSRPDAGAAAKEGRRHSRFMCPSLPPQTYLISTCTLYAQKYGRVVCQKFAHLFNHTPEALGVIISSVALVLRV
jgi:hypothetical protein